MRFLHPERDKTLELSLSDVFIVPSLYEGLSRREVNLSPTDFEGSSNPLVSANMNAVTGRRMAETIARYGGLGVIPQDMSLERMLDIIRFVKSAPVQCDTPLVLEGGEFVQYARGLINKRSHGMVVVNLGGKFYGVVTASDLKEVDPYTPVREVASTDVIKLPSSASPSDHFAMMEAARLKSAPVFEDGEFVGVLSKEDAVRFSFLKPSLDKKGRLMVGAAVGISSEDVETTVKYLVGAEVDFIVVDTAHGHQRRMGEVLLKVSSFLRSRGVPLVAGNVCTKEGVRFLVDHGADIVKVNVGPGAMCTTRMQTGAGRPTFSAVKECSEEARRQGAHVWADGGVKHPRDVALYLAAGATRVMLGTVLSGTYESPGEVKFDTEGHPYKENYGMASLKAVKGRNGEKSAFDLAVKSLYREGISSSKIYLKEGSKSVGDVVTKMVTGLQSSFTYAGSKDIREFRQNVVIGVQTSSGYTEGTPHGKIVK